MSDAPFPLLKGDFVYRQSSVPVFTKASGSRLVDQDGQDYIDLESANGAALFGYNPGLLEDAIRRMSSLPSAPSFVESERRLETAELLTSLIAEQTGLRGRIAFETSGAMGIELALRIARLHGATGPVVTFEGAYHGRSGLTAGLSASSRYRSAFGQQIEVVRLPLPDCEACRFGLSPTRCRAECADFAETLLTEDFAGVSLRNGRRPIFLFEPILNVAGMVRPDTRYLQRVVEIIRQVGGVIIADEIFTGLWRTGRAFGFQDLNVEPDIVVLSKILTNGLAPLAAVWCRDDTVSDQAFPPGSHSTTFANCQFSLACASAVLARMHDAKAIEMAVRQQERQLADFCLAATGLRQDDRPIFSGFRQFGLCAALRLAQPVAAEVRARLMKPPCSLPSRPAVLVAQTGMARFAINLHPSLLTTDRDYLGATDAFHACLAHPEFA